MQDGVALDDIKKLIDAGREKGYLTYNEVNDLIPHDVHSPEDLDDLTTIGTQGIDVLEGQPKLSSWAREISPCDRRCAANSAAVSLVISSSLRLDSGL